MRVRLHFFEEWPTFERTLRNVTEIHYCYPGVTDSPRVAFESTIHATGVTYEQRVIAEFEAVMETEEAEEF